MHFSKASTYGIRSVAYMAARGDREMISIRELSRELDIPPAFLTKVMQRLASRDIVQTMRGYGGGVALGRPPGDITLKDIIIAVEGDESFHPIGLGIPAEQMKKTPDFFEKWSRLNNSIDLFFSNTKLSELCPAGAVVKTTAVQTTAAKTPGVKTPVRVAATGKGSSKPGKHSV